MKYLIFLFPFLAIGQIPADGMYFNNTAVEKAYYNSTQVYPSTPITPTDDPLFVIMGASIMSSAFNQEATVASEINTALGSDIQFQQLAVSGGRLVTLSEKIEQVLDSINNVPTRETYCVFHIGGNDMNLIRPYSGNQIEDVDVFTKYWDTIIKAVENRGFIPIIGNLSYRTYEGASSPDVTTEDTGSQPYNSKFWIPDSNKYAGDYTYSSGMPWFQMYELMYEGGDAQDVADNTYMHDGVHPTSLGVSKIREMFRTQVVEPILTGIPPTQKYLANGRPHEAVISEGTKTTTSIVVNWKPVSDPQGILKYEIYLDGVYVDEVTGGFNTYTLTGLTSSTQYRIYVVAEDNDNQRSYESNDLWVITPSASGSQMISYVDTNTRPAGILGTRVSPWLNVGRQKWTNRRNTATTTPNTGPVNGPDRDGVQQAGNYYYYVETSSVAGQGGDFFIEGDAGISGNNATIQSDELDASAYSLYLKIAYHMFFGLDTINQNTYMVIECWNGTSWIEEFRATGSQQSASTDPFLLAIVNASAYTNTDFKFRMQLRFIGVNSSAYRDVAWANPEIWNGVPD